jgi:DNA-binding transcriptional MerR regulator
MSTSTEPAASPSRAASGQRVYAADSVERVRLLRRLYSAGLTSKIIASLLPCVDTPSAAVTRESMDVMRREHARISVQITELITTRDDLSYLIDAAVSCHRDQLATDAATALTAATACTLLF